MIENIDNTSTEGVDGRKKSGAAFRTISEVASEIGVAQHVLRFWETKFNQIQPIKRGGGRRYYRPEDVLLLRSIRDFLYDDRYTIEGVQKLFKENTIKDIISGKINIGEIAPNLSKENPIVSPEVLTITPVEEKVETINLSPIIEKLENISISLKKLAS